MDETPNTRRGETETQCSGSHGLFLAGGAIGLLVGLVIGTLCARPIAAAVRSLRRRMGSDGEPHFEFLAQ